MIRVLVVSGSAVVRAGLETLVRESPTLTLAGTAAGLDESGLLSKAGRLKADVILIEREAGEDSADELAAIEPHSGGAGDPAVPGIVVLADDPPARWIAMALRGGVRAVLPRDATVVQIVAAIQAAAAGLTVLPPELVNSLLDEQPGGSVSATARAGPQIRAGGETEALTPRELQILGLLAQGLGNKEIAWQIKLSEHTVKFHLASIFGKLNASTRTEAVTQGLRLGLIML